MRCQNYQISEVAINNYIFDPKNDNMKVLLTASYCEEMINCKLQ